MTYSTCTTIAEEFVWQNPDAISLFGNPTTITTSTAQTSTTAIIQHGVIATYQLEQNQQSSSSSTRTGSLVPFTVTSTTRDDQPSTFKVSQHKFLETPAILDVCNTKRALHAACGSKDSVLTFGYNDNFAEVFHDHNNYMSVRTPQVEQESLTLSVSVSQTENIVASTRSTGDVILSSPWESECRRIHNAEAWTCCLQFDSANTIDSRSSYDAHLNQVTVFSGADDGILASWCPKEAQLHFQMRNVHKGMGVTSVALRHCEQPNWELWSGGYDDVLKVWDRRIMRQELNECNLGGGIWRIKWHPKHPNIGLIATMYDGAKVIRFDPQTATIECIAEYKQHESIVYGATWLAALETVPHQLIGMTSSFYDRNLKLWTVDIGCS